MFDDINDNAKKEKTVKSSPIFVVRINNSQLLSQMLQEITIDEYEIKLINNEPVKIQHNSKSTIAT